MAPETITEPIQEDEPDVITLDEALAALAGRGAQSRPYSSRVESACNDETMDVINTWALEAWRGSRSDAIRDLIAIAGETIAARRAERA